MKFGIGVLHLVSFVKYDNWRIVIVVLRGDSNEIFVAFYLFLIKFG